MIRRFEESDLDEVMSIWLTANMEAHSFINTEYWKNSFDAVKEMIPTAEVFVSESEGQVNGFIGMIDNYIAGIFVRRSDRSKGVGTELLNIAKQKKDTLNLHVYQDNKSAVLFYKNAGFRIKAEETDSSTLQKEYVMEYCI